LKKENKSLNYIQVLFWVVTPFSVAIEYQRFGGSCCLHLHPECWCVTIQKTSTYIYTTVKTLNVTLNCVN